MFGCRRQLMNKCEHEGRVGRQVKNTVDLALGLQRGTNRLILLGAFQASLVFEGKLSRFIIDPKLNNGIVVFLIWRAGNHIYGADLDLRLPTDQQSISSQS